MTWYDLDELWKSFGSENFKSRPSRLNTRLNLFSSISYGRLIVSTWKLGSDVAKALTLSYFVNIVHSPRKLSYSVVEMIIGGFEEKTIAELEGLSRADPFYKLLSRFSLPGLRADSFRERIEENSQQESVHWLCCWSDRYWRLQIETKSDWRGKLDSNIVLIKPQDPTN